MFPFSARHSNTVRSADFAWSSVGAALQRLIPALARRNSAGHRLEHLETLLLTARSSVALIRAGGDTLLLAITPQGISLLAKNPANTAPCRGESVSFEAEGLDR